MVEKVIEFTPKPQSHSLLNGNVLKQGDVPIVGARSAEYHFARVADEV